jgi:hypothetical protein
MRSPKPYTNAAFTKRVDHGGGRRRTPRSPAEPSACTVCYAVYVHRRWTLVDRMRKDDWLRFLDGVHEIVCPACRQEAKGQRRGVVHLSGERLVGHHTEIVNLVYNEERRAREDNPMARVLAVDDLAQDQITVSTTTEHLAQRLGHALEKAYGGAAHFDVSRGNKLARVTWHRD